MNSSEKKVYSVDVFPEEARNIVSLIEVLLGSASISKQIWDKASFETNVRVATTMYPFMEISFDKVN